MALATQRRLLHTLSVFHLKLRRRCPRLTAGGQACRPSPSSLQIGGEAGIRTRGGVSPTHALQACSFNHSDTSPLSAISGHPLGGESRQCRPGGIPVGRRCRPVSLAERVGFEPTWELPPNFRGGPVTTASVPLPTNGSMQNRQRKTDDRPTFPEIDRLSVVRLLFEIARPASWPGRPPPA